MKLGFPKIMYWQFNIFSTLLKDGKVDLPLPGDQTDETKYPNYFGENSANLAGEAEEAKYPNFFGKRVDAVPAKPGM